MTFESWSSTHRLPLANLPPPTTPDAVAVSAQLGARPAPSSQSSRTLRRRKRFVAALGPRTARGPFRGPGTIFPLVDFNPRRDENVSRRYLQGMYGAIPIVNDAEFAAVLETLHPKSQESTLEPPLPTDTPNRPDTTETSDPRLHRRRGDRSDLLHAPLPGTPRTSRRDHRPTPWDTSHALATRRRRADRKSVV